jgi:arylsulfatase A
MGVASEAGEKKHFGDMVNYCDKMVGKIIAKLDALKIRDNTLVIFIGDNGTGAGVVTETTGGKVIGGKGSTRDTGTHVPLIVNWPAKITTGRVSSDLVDSTDFLPTMLAAAGVAPPKTLELDGRSFLPRLLGQAGTPREWIYCWYSRNGGAKGAELARDQKYKLYADGNMYDVVKDPGESQPLDAASATAEVKAAREKLQKALDSYKGTRSAAAVTGAGGGQGKKGKKKAAKETDS